MQKRIVLKIYGRVHGVFFRDSSLRMAKKLGLSGWVRNEPNEIVIIVAEGEEVDLQWLADWCKDGPEHAKVEKVDVEWLEATGGFDGFMVG